MKIKQYPDKSNNMRYAKEFSISEHYVVVCTGSRVIIYNKDLEILHQVEVRRYTYDCFISPDEKHLLLVCTDNNFYTLSLCDFKLIKHTIPRKYCDSLEGKGCWTADGTGVIIPMEKNLISTVRIYTSIENETYYDILEGQYFIISIKYVASVQKYLAIGLNRKNECWNLIWISQNNDVVSYVIRTNDDPIRYAEINERNSTISIIGYVQDITVDFQGRLVSENRDLESSEIYNVVKSVVTRYVPLQEICCFQRSEANKDLVYIGTSHSLVILNMKMHALVASVKVEYGVQQVSEINSNRILISTWNGVKVFDLID